MSIRGQRIESDIKRELSVIFPKLKDHRIKGMISIVKLDLANDQSYCKVYVSSMLGKEQTLRCIEGLDSAAGFIRKELAARVKMRRSPKLKFIADDSIQYSAKLAKMLKELDVDE